MRYAEQNDASKQATAFLLVVLLHFGIVYALVTGLGRQAIEVIRGPIETRIIDDIKAPPP
ncbi:MAG TPA: energy transducer TonB, partial [Rhodospirillaceae bacterium]|nr:energy transducer TonB [Rhodospirillaceae bacterium]